MERVMSVELTEVRGMSDLERAQARESVSIKSPDHLLAFLDASERTWLIFNTDHLIRSLPWPEGVLMMQRIVSWYRDYRIQVGEALEIPEAERAIRFLLDRIRERDPSWTLARL
jgi:hypothetical protein